MRLGPEPTFPPSSQEMVTRWEPPFGLMAEEEATAKGPTVSTTFSCTALTRPLGRDWLVMRGFYIYCDNQARLSDAHCKEERLSSVTLSATVVRATRLSKETRSLAAASSSTIRGRSPQ